MDQPLASGADRIASGGGPPDPAERPPRFVLAHPRDLGHAQRATQRRQQKVGGHGNHPDLMFPVCSITPGTRRHPILPAFGYSTIMPLMCCPIREAERGGYLAALFWF